MTGAFFAVLAISTVAALLRHRPSGPTWSVPVIIDADHMLDGGGAACVSMILEYFGVITRVAEVRAEIRVPQGGTNALAMLNAARARGLAGEGLQLSRVEDLELLAQPCIMHMGDDRFVVLRTVRRHRIEIVDPAHGLCSRRPSALWREMSGIVLTFEPPPRESVIDLPVARTLPTRR